MCLSYRSWFSHTQMLDITSCYAIPQLILIVNVTQGLVHGSSGNLPLTLFVFTFRPLFQIGQCLRFHIFRFFLGISHASPLLQCIINVIIICLSTQKQQVYTEFQMQYFKNLIFLSCTCILCYIFLQSNGVNNSSVVTILAFTSQ